MNIIPLRCMSIMRLKCGQIPIFVRGSTYLGQGYGTRVSLASLPLHFRGAPQSATRVAETVCLYFSSLCVFFRRVNEKLVVCNK